MVDIEPFVMKVPDYNESPPRYRQVSVDDYGTIISQRLDEAIGTSVVPDFQEGPYELTLMLTTPIDVISTSPLDGAEFGKITCLKATLGKNGLITFKEYCAPYYEPTPK
jgi:hypothetical protein